MRKPVVSIAVCVLILVVTTAASRGYLPKYNRPIILAHRGSRYMNPENTIIAYETAVEMGADVLELDVNCQ